MADIDNASEYQLLVDGAPVTPDEAAAASTANVIATTFTDTDGTVYVRGKLAGNAAINVTKAGRSGSVALAVADVPLAVPLGPGRPRTD